jgi:alcohol dehydrogenase
VLAAANAADAELIVGFGGGSAMDLAKLAAVLAGSSQTLHDVVGPNKVAAPRRVALAQVPTTSGTGSEAGIRALVTDPKTQAKLAVESMHMLADIAVIDPGPDLHRASAVRRLQPASMPWPIASRPSPIARRIR